MEPFAAAAAQYNQMYADDDMERYEPALREEKLLQSYHYVEQKFEAMVKELHMPFLDCKLFRKYFLSQRTEANLTSLARVVSALSQHKAQTIALLRLIFEREQLVSATKAVAGELSKGKVTTLEAQTKVLQLLYAIQQATLNVVEGVQEWRALLSRPYPFEWRGVNYLVKILKDCQIIESSVLKAVLPLQLSTYPLCSNLSSLSLFGPSYTADPVKGTAVAITYPMKLSKLKQQQGQAILTPEMQLRLEQAEAVVLSEHELQVNLFKELSEMTTKGTFITVLNVREVVPNCCEGIRLSNKEWDQRLKTAISESFKKLDPKAAEEQPVASSAAAADGNRPGSASAREERRDEDSPKSSFAAENSVSPKKNESS